MRGFGVRGWTYSPSHKPCGNGEAAIGPRHDYDAVWTDETGHAPHFEVRGPLTFHPHFLQWQKDQTGFVLGRPDSGSAILKFELNGRCERYPVKVRAGGEDEGPFERKTGRVEDVGGCDRHTQQRHTLDYVPRLLRHFALHVVRVSKKYRTLVMSHLFSNMPKSIERGGR